MNQQKVGPSSHSAPKYFTLKRLVSFILFVPIGCWALSKPFPFLISGQPGTNVIANYVFMMLVITGLTLIFKVPWRPLLTFSLALLAFIPVLFATASATGLIAWTLRPGLFGETATFSVDKCSPESDVYRCSGTMQLESGESFQTYMYSQTDHKHSEAVVGTSYSDPFPGIGYFEAGGTPPQIDPAYAIGSFIAIATPLTILFLIRRYCKQRNIEGWFWTIENSALNMRQVQIGIQILGLLIFTLGIAVFVTLIASDLNAQPGAEASQSTLFRMSPGDYLTISGIGFALFSAVEGFLSGENGISSKVSPRVRSIATKVIWTISLYVSILALALIAVRLSNPVRHNLIPLETRHKLQEALSDLAILDSSFSWANILAILALAITIVLLAFTKYHNLSKLGDLELNSGSGNGRSRAENAIAAFFVVFTDRFDDVKLFDLYKQTEGGQQTARLLIRMKLIEVKNGRAKPTDLGRQLIGD